MLTDLREQVDLAIELIEKRITTLLDTMREREKHLSRGTAKQISKLSLHYEELKRRHTDLTQAALALEAHMIVFNTALDHTVVLIEAQLRATPA